MATPLPNNWLAETPQALALMGLGRQSAERERISEINCNFSKGRLVLSRSMFKISLSFMLFPVILIRLKKFATLLPNNWLAETPQALALMGLGRQSAERERISEINCNFF
ncbi:hypothetical protein ACIQWQ_11700 [Peribacillus frigoritolerans]